LKISPKQISGRPSFITKFNFFCKYKDEVIFNFQPNSIPIKNAILVNFKVNEILKIVDQSTKSIGKLKKNPKSLKNGSTSSYKERSFYFWNGQIDKIDKTEKPISLP
jgi:hypothetical protein